MTTASPEPGPEPVAAGELHCSCVETLAGWRSDEADQERLRLRFLDHLTGRPDGWSRHCPGAHLTASALICAAEEERVLLVAHRKVGRWLQAGGHLEADDRSLPAAALREASEESGLAELSIDPRPLRLSAHPVPFCGGGSDHLDVQFLVRVSGLPAPVVSAESEDVRWFVPGRVPAEDRSVVDLVAAAGRRLGWSHGTA